jgi:SAM-dependent methyltransferase
MEILITAEKTPCCGPDCCAAPRVETTTVETTTVETTTVETTTVLTPDELKSAVRDKYAAIAEDQVQGCGCGSSCCGSGEVDMIGDAYAGVEGYVAEADLGLGCGLPTELANLQPGNSVLDLGSGAGIDAFVARRIVGETGEVLGVDMTPPMVARATANAAKLGYTNVHFLLGDIEALPLPDARVDVVVSNCVLNLVPDKPSAFAEMYRVLKPGGHFSVSDIVVRGNLPETVKQSAELYAGCIAGAIEQDEYLEMLRQAGFTDVRVVREREIVLPDALLLEYATPEELALFRERQCAILSATIYGVKPLG